MNSTAVDRGTVAREWKARGFSCDLWIDPPGQRWEDFVHATDEIVMLVEGEIEMEIDRRVIVPAVGEEVLIPARARHSVRNTGGRTARWLYGYRRGG
jgi:mannose-6-phosphate isomerase-like protein (cupin superfamily)